MLAGFPLAFFVPLVVHVVAGLTTVIIGVITFSLPKRAGAHHQWGRRYVWAYTLVVLTATFLSVQRWERDAYLFVLAVLGLLCVLVGYAARRFRHTHWMQLGLRRQWVVVHIVGMIGSYVVLLTAFYVDNAHLIPLLNQLPLLTFWVLPSVIGLAFMVLSIARFAPKQVPPSKRAAAPRKGAMR